MINFPTVPDMAEKAGCFVFGHDWMWVNKTTQECRNCEERRKR